MPLHDHFRPPVDDHHHWEGFFGGWPAVIVQQLRKTFPPGYRAGPRVHLGTVVEPGIAASAVVPDQYEYAVHVYDTSKQPQLVAAIEFVCPANKDSPQSRSVFAAKCAALIQQGVAVSIVDLVTTTQFNLYLDLLEMFEGTDPTLGDPPLHLYAAASRGVKGPDSTTLQAWSHRLEVGRPLPTLPLWLDVDRFVPLDLEASYEQACYDLSIT